MLPTLLKKISLSPNELLSGAPFMRFDTVSLAKLPPTSSVEYPLNMRLGLRSHLLPTKSELMQSAFSMECPIAIVALLALATS